MAARDADILVRDLGVPDPLNTFSMTPEQYHIIQDAVREEGFDSWDSYAPTIVAAIQDGFLDRHLQVLGKYLRARWMELLDGDASPAFQDAISDDEKNEAEEVEPPVLPPAPFPTSTLSAPSTYEELKQRAMARHPMVRPIQPIRRHAPGETAGSGQFRVHGYIFDKNDLEDRCFVFRTKDKLAIMCIKKVDKVNATCEAIEVSKGMRVGDRLNFRLAVQRNWFDVPEAPGFNKNSGEA